MLADDLCDVWRLEHLADVDSTNQELLRRVRAGTAYHGQVLLTDMQNEGRGQFDRRWVCPRGEGLLVSWLLELRLPGPSLSLLSPLTALAVVDALRDTGVVAWWKWPNDIMLLHGGGAKVGGILIQTIHQGEQCHAVCGLGLNLAQENLPAELRQPACSLRSAGLDVVGRIELLESVLRHIHGTLPLLQDPARLLMRLDSVDLLRERTVRLVRGDEVRECKVLGYTDTGGVRIGDTKGETVYHAGEIHLLPDRRN